MPAGADVDERHRSRRLDLQQHQSVTCTRPGPDRRGRVVHRDRPQRHRLGHDDRDERDQHGESLRRRRSQRRERHQSPRRSTAPICTIDKAQPTALRSRTDRGMFTLTVTNIGPGATHGTVTVTDTLLPGLTPTGPTGTEWLDVHARWPDGHVHPRRFDRRRAVLSGDHADRQRGTGRVARTDQHGDGLGRRRHHARKQLGDDQRRDSHRLASRCRRSTSRRTTRAPSRRVAASRSPSTSATSRWRRRRCRIVVTDPLPSILAPTAAGGGGFTCTIAQTVHVHQDRQPRRRTPTRS